MEFTEEVEKEQYGEKFEYEPEGPIQKNRVKTDFCWFVGFIVYLVAWSIVIIYAFANGDTSKWTDPTDSEGRVCGRERDVYKKPFLVYYYDENLFITRKFCHDACPTENFEYDAFRGHEVKDGDEAMVGNTDTTESTTAVASLDATKSATTTESAVMIEGEAAKEPTATTATSTRKLLKKREAVGDQLSTTGKSKRSMEINEEVRRKMICKADVKIDLVTTWEQLNYLVDHNKCMGNYVKSSSESNRCLTTEEPRYFFDRKKDADLSFMGQTHAHISKTTWSTFGFVLLSVIISVLCIILMRWYALSFVFGTMFTLCITIFYFIYEKCVLEGDQTSRTGGILLALFLCVVVLVVVVLIAIYFRNQITLACDLITESSKAVTCISSIFAVPFVLFFVFLLVLALSIGTFIVLASIDTPIYKAEFVEFESCKCTNSLGYKDGSSCYPDIFKKECLTKNGTECVLSGCYLVEKKTDSLDFLHFINFFGLFWIYFFLVSYGDMILASVFANWYFTFNKKILTYTSIVESFWIVGTYHLGTIAFGSLLILVCSIIKYILRAMKISLKKTNRPFAACIMSSLKCVFDLLEGFFNFISRRALIMCAIHGTDFMQSARTAYYLMMRNMKKVIGVNGITNVMLFILTIIIAYVTSRISLSYFSSRDDLIFTGLLSVIVFLGSFLVTWLIMRLMNIAIDTIFICFLEDSERNDGSHEKPYFMSEELTKFLKHK